VAVADAEIGPPPVTAYAVTPSLREWYADGDLEELEYAATLAAARASLRLLADDSSAVARRVVIAAEVDDGWVRPVPDVDRAAVLVTEPVQTAQVVSVHVDDAATADVIASAVAVVRKADIGDDDAMFLVDEAQAQELQWYATQEIEGLLGEALE
jgi:hypothetical protein